MTTTNSLQYKKCYKAWSKSEKVVNKSSSGGAFYEVAKTVLSEGGVVFGVAFQEDGTVQYEGAETEDEVERLMGSKYVQAKANQVYSSVKKHLVEGHKVLFCGTPCQCNALKAFLNKKEYQNLFTVDFICHGVPSEGVWEKYLEWIAQDRKVSTISFRDKTISWGDYGTRILFKNGTEYFQSCGIPFNRSKVFAAIAECPEKVFENPQKYTQTSFTEKAIRKCIRVWRNLTKPEINETYLKLNEMQRIAFKARAMCCGCGACESACPVHAISMELDGEGFRYPVIDNGTCIHCNLCEKVCLNRFR